MAKQIINIFDLTFLKGFLGTLKRVASSSTLLTSFTRMNRELLTPLIHAVILFFYRAYTVLMRSDLSSCQLRTNILKNLSLAGRHWLFIQGKCNYILRSYYWLSIIWSLTIIENSSDCLPPFNLVQVGKVRVVKCLFNPKFEIKFWKTKVAQPSLYF